MDRERIDKLVEDYADTIKRICFSYTKNYHDTQDVMQNVFIKYMNKAPKFTDQEHEKAWIIRTTINACKDNLKAVFRSHASLDNMDWDMSVPEETDLSYVREAVQKLPSKYKNVIMLHYFEDLSAVEIGKILGKNENTIYTWLKRGREKLEEMIGGGDFE